MQLFIGSDSVQFFLAFDPIRCKKKNERKTPVMPVGLKYIYKNNIASLLSLKASLLLISV